MNDSAFRQIVHAIVRRPASIHPMGPIAPEAMHWLLSRSPEVLTFGELDLILECEFEAALYYLPAAIRYIEQMRQEWPQVANFAIRFISSRQYEIGLLGIGSAMLERIYAVFDAVTSEFSVESNVQHAWAAVVHGGERVDFVDSIFKHPLPCSPTLFDAVIDRWAHDFGPWQRSATLLDLLMHRDWSPVGHLIKVFQSPQIKKLRSERALLRQHWEFAEAEMSCICPPEYVEYLLCAILEAPPKGQTSS